MATNLVEKPDPATGVGRSRSAIVIGAGVVGVATAYALARRGMAVTLIDSRAEAGQGTSFANGAQLSYVYTDALANPSLLRRAPGLLLGLDPVFRMRVPTDLGYLRWLLRFVRNMSGSHFRQNTLEGLRLGLESRVAMHRLLEQHAFEFGHVTNGKLNLYDDARAFAATRGLVELKRAAGAIQQLLTAGEARDVEPALAARAQLFAGAVYSPQEEVGDPYRFCNGLMGVLKRHYGADIRLGTEIQAIDEARGGAVVTARGERIEAGIVVLCAGIESRHFLGQLGLRGTLVPMKGYSFTAPKGAAAPGASITDVARKFVICPLNGAIRVAGGADLGAPDNAVVRADLERLVGTARDILPQAADYSQAGSGWAGLRSMTASSLPVIRRIGPRLALNVGHGTLGWTFAMGSAERLASMVLEPQGMQ